MKKRVFIIIIAITLLLTITTLQAQEEKQESFLNKLKEFFNFNWLFEKILLGPGDCEDSSDCDDGNECTIDSCKIGYSGGFCYHENIPECELNKLCEDVDCDDGNSCTKDYCSLGDCFHEYISGCTSRGCTSNADCDDGNVCTYDYCRDGVCYNSDRSHNCVPCSDNSDCSDCQECSDGRCIEITDCTPEIFDGCIRDSDCDDGNECTRDTCESNGYCNNEEIIGCGDELPSGECNTDSDCDDGNECTRDTCESNGYCNNEEIIGCGDELPSGECNTDSDCDDGNACNGIERCQNNLWNYFFGGAVCKPGTPMNCDDGDECTIDSCKNSQCIHQRIIGCRDECETSEDCDDGNECTNDYCYSGKCEYEEILNCRDECQNAEDCNDNDECTNDYCYYGECRNDRIQGCDPDSCVKDSDCDDDNKCTKDICNEGECNYNEIDCNDYDECTNDYCDTLKGCVNEEIPGCSNYCEPVSCRTNLDCNINMLDDCAYGICGYNDITGEGECVFTIINGFCDDGNVCNGHEYCNINLCEGSIGCSQGPDIDCDDGDFCTTDICNPRTGCEHRENACDDRVSCTIDSCNDNGCSYEPDDSLCPEGYTCNPESGCIQTECIGCTDCDGFFTSCTYNKCHNHCFQDGGCYFQGNSLFQENCIPLSEACSGIYECSEYSQEECNNDPCGLGGCAFENGKCNYYVGICGDSICSGDETCLTCPEDCGKCPESVCGNDDCEILENCLNCENDCGICNFECGNGECELGEDCNNCKIDCGECDPICGNGECEERENCFSCEEDCGECGPLCGDEICQENEDCSSCGHDCKCENAETCENSKCYSLIEKGYAPETKVLTKNNIYKPISEISKGDMILAYSDFSTNQRTLVQVEKVYKNIRGNLYKIKIQGGGSVKLTENNYLFTENGWKKIGNGEDALKAGDKIFFEEGYKEVVEVSFIGTTENNYNLKNKNYNTFIIKFNPGAAAGDASFIPCCSDYECRYRKTAQGIVNHDYAYCSVCGGSEKGCQPAPDGDKCGNNYGIFEPEGTCINIYPDYCKQDDTTATIINHKEKYPQTSYCRQVGRILYNQEPIVNNIKIESFWVKQNTEQQGNQEDPNDASVNEGYLQDNCNPGEDGCELRDFCVSDCVWSWNIETTSVEEEFDCHKDYGLMSCESCAEDIYGNEIQRCSYVSDRDCDSYSCMKPNATIGEDGCPTYECISKCDNREICFQGNCLDCVTHEDCQDNYGENFACINNICEKPCASDEFCYENEICQIIEGDEYGVCVSQNNLCEEDSNCEDNEICIRKNENRILNYFKKQCVSINGLEESCITCEGSSCTSEDLAESETCYNCNAECLEDTDCSDFNYKCINGICIDACNEDKSCSMLSNDLSECVNSCKEDEKCENGICIHKCKEKCEIYNPKNGNCDELIGRGCIEKGWETQNEKTFRNKLYGGSSELGIVDYIEKDYQGKTGNYVNPFSLTGEGVPYCSAYDFLVKEYKDIPETSNCASKIIRICDEDNPNMLIVKREYYDADPGNGVSCEKEDEILEYRDCKENGLGYTCDYPEDNFLGIFSIPNEENARCEIDERLEKVGCKKIYNVLDFYNQCSDSTCSYPNNCKIESFIENTFIHNGKCENQGISYIYDPMEFINTENKELLFKDTYPVIPLFTNENPDERYVYLEDFTGTEKENQKIILKKLIELENSAYTNELDLREIINQAESILDNGLEYNGRTILPKEKIKLMFNIAIANFYKIRGDELNENLENGFLKIGYPNDLTNNNPTLTLESITLITELDEFGKEKVIGWSPDSEPFIPIELEISSVPYYYPISEYKGANLKIELKNTLERLRENSLLTSIQTTPIIEDNRITQRDDYWTMLGNYNFAIERYENIKRSLETTDKDEFAVICEEIAKIYKKKRELHRVEEQYLQIINNPYNNEVKSDAYVALADFFTGLSIITPYEQPNLVKALQYSIKAIETKPDNQLTIETNKLIEKYIFDTIIERISGLNKDSFDVLMHNLGPWGVWFCAVEDNYDLIDEYETNTEETTTTKIGLKFLNLIYEGTELHESMELREFLLKERKEQAEIISKIKNFGEFPSELSNEERYTVGKTLCAIEEAVCIPDFALFVNKGNKEEAENLMFRYGCKNIDRLKPYFKFKNPNSKDYKYQTVADTWRHKILRHVNFATIAGTIGAGALSKTIVGIAGIISRKTTLRAALTMSIEYPFTKGTSNVVVNTALKESAKKGFLNQFTRQGIRFVTNKGMEIGTAGLRLGQGMIEFAVFEEVAYMVTGNRDAAYILAIGGGTLRGILTGPAKPKSYDLLVKQNKKVVGIEAKSSANLDEIMKAVEREITNGNPNLRIINDKEFMQKILVEGVPKEVQFKVYSTHHLPPNYIKIRGKDILKAKKIKSKLNELKNRKLAPKEAKEVGLEPALKSESEVLTRENLNALSETGEHVIVPGYNEYVKVTHRGNSHIGIVHHIDEKTGEALIYLQGRQKAKFKLGKDVKIEHLSADDYARYPDLPRIENPTAPARVIIQDEVEALAEETARLEVNQHLKKAVAYYEGTTAPLTLQQLKMRGLSRYERQSRWEDFIREREINYETAITNTRDAIQKMKNEGIRFVPVRKGAVEKGAVYRDPSIGNLPDKYPDHPSIYGIDFIEKINKGQDLRHKIAVLRNTFYYEEDIFNSELRRYLFGNTGSPLNIKMTYEDFISIIELTHRYNYYKLRNKFNGRGNIPFYGMEREVQFFSHFVELRGIIERGKRVGAVKIHPLFRSVDDTISRLILNRAHMRGRELQRSLVQTIDPSAP